MNTSKKNKGHENIQLETIEALKEYDKLLSQIITKQKQIIELTKEQEKLKFYTISDIVEMTGYCKKTVEKIFNDPEFKACTIGKTKVVLAEQAKKYFASGVGKNNSVYWRNI